MKQGVEEYIRYYHHEQVHITLGDLTPIKHKVRCLVVLNQASIGRVMRGESLDT
ncbi:hypothetical protein [Shewanella sp. VB17]|uniref:hypothetical protein n=1 Tax=Shewanella sp. VB17 TaxID=2739432 RepID=UPI0035C8C627